MIYITNKSNYYTFYYAIQNKNKNFVLKFLAITKQTKMLIMY